MAFFLVGCRSAPAPETSPAPVLAATDISNAPTPIGRETFSLTGEQAQEIAVFMNFIHAYNNARTDDALALLSENIVGSDCDYQEVKIISFRGKSQAAEWLRNRFSEHDSLDVGRIFNENPDPSGEHVIGVEYSRRSSTTLAKLGFGEGITPKLASKVIFGVAPALITAFANGPYGGDPNFCRPGH